MGGTGTVGSRTSGKRNGDIFQGAYVESPKPCPKGMQPKYMDQAVVLTGKKLLGTEEDALSFLGDISEPVEEVTGPVATAAENVVDATAATAEGAVKTTAKGVAGIVETAGELLTDTASTVRNGVTELFSSSGAQVAHAAASAPNLASGCHAAKKDEHKKKHSSSHYSNGAVHYAVADTAIMEFSQESSLEPQKFTISGDHFKAARTRFHKETFGEEPEQGFGCKALPVSMSFSGGVMVSVPHETLGRTTVKYPGAVRGTVHEPDAKDMFHSNSSLGAHVNRLGYGSGAHCCQFPTPGGGAAPVINTRAILCHQHAQETPKTKEEIGQQSIIYSGGDIMVRHGSIAHHCAGETSLGRALSSATLADAGDNQRVFTGIKPSEVKSSLGSIARKYNGSLPIHDLERNGLCVEFTPVSGSHADASNANFSSVLAAYPSGSKMHVQVQYAIKMHDPSVEE